MSLRKIPKEDLVLKNIIFAIQKRMVIRSQEEFRLLVLDELKKQDKKYKLSSKRLKKLLLKIPEIGIKAKTKRMPKMRILKKCPVCENGIRKVFIKNLAGKKTPIGYKCNVCGYSADIDAFMPLRYIFVLKEK